MWVELTNGIRLNLDHIEAIAPRRGQPPGEPRVWQFYPANSTERQFLGRTSRKDPVPTTTASGWSGESSGWSTALSCWEGCLVDEAALDHLGGAEGHSTLPGDTPPNGLTTGNGSARRQ